MLFHFFLFSYYAIDFKPIHTFLYVQCTAESNSINTPTMNVCIIMIIIFMILCAKWTNQSKLVLAWILLLLFLFSVFGKCDDYLEISIIGCVYSHRIHILAHAFHVLFSFFGGKYYVYLIFFISYFFSLQFCMEL